MKFKVGDRVKFVKSTYGHSSDVKVGEIYKIKTVDTTGIPYQTENLEWFMEEELESVDYTYEDLKKSPIGTKITFENGEVLVKDYDGNYDNAKHWREELELKELEDKCEKLGKIIKIEEPTYTTVYEVKQEILDEAEKRYLREIIRPFRDKVKAIRKTDNNMNGKNNQYITVIYKNDLNTDFPNFKPNTMYKGMKLYKEYTLEELGL